MSTDMEMSDIEKTVMDAILKGKAPPDDLHAIAKVCRISEVEASVAVQLLSYRKLLPTLGHESARTSLPA
ncbi:MAG: hypothetical protein JWR03_1048 [Cohnella sp.]|jgi:hypothetical protein|nr:hypothetical protein [Cohnella sp.]